MKVDKNFSKSLEEALTAIHNLNHIRLHVKALSILGKTNKTMVWVAGNFTVTDYDDNGHGHLGELSIYYINPFDDVDRLQCIIYRGIDVRSFDVVSSFGDRIISFLCDGGSKRVQFTIYDAVEVAGGPNSLYELQFDNYSELVFNWKRFKRLLEFHPLIMKKMNTILRLPTIETFKGTSSAGLFDKEHDLINGEYKLIPSLRIWDSGLELIIRAYCMEHPDVSFDMDQIIEDTFFRDHTNYHHCTTGMVHIKDIEDMVIDNSQLKVIDTKLNLVYPRIANFDTVCKGGIEVADIENAGENKEEKHMTGWLMKQNPYEYSVKELESAFKLLTKTDGPVYIFKLYGRNVIFVYGNFSFVDCDGRGNLEIYYIDPKRSNNKVQCVVFQQINANRITVLPQRDSDSIKIVGSYNTYDGNKAHDFYFNFIKCDEFDDPITTTAITTRMNVIELFESHPHVTNSLSLINNMIPVDYVDVSRLCGNPFTLDKEKGFGYKLIPSISFTIEDHVVFSINIIKYNRDFDADAFETARLMVTRTRFNHDDGLWTADTDYIPSSALDSITVSVNGISVNDPEGRIELLLNYNPDLGKHRSSSSNFKKMSDKSIVNHNSHKNGDGTSVKVISYNTITLDDCPMLEAKNKVFRNVIDVTFDKENGRKFNIVISDGTDSSTVTYDFSEYYELTRKTIGGTRFWIFVNFKEQKAYEIQKID